MLENRQKLADIGEKSGITFVLITTAYVLDPADFADFTPINPQQMTI